MINNILHCINTNIIEESVYKPNVPLEFVPIVNSIFKSLNLPLKMYIDYAEMIIYENVYGTTHYNVKQLFELHNHPLESIVDEPYIKNAREMSYFEKEFVVHT
uniref:Uncharacterized protein n=1 Tax=Lactuca sativa TaxID=4236 RepID=A0A9R1WQ97_LACSA|nr:hypothetical protein LSAT_V11C100042630 [Lactuca sativa]